MDPQSFDLAGKVALVTGGASGIGLAISQALVQNGARVISVDKSFRKGGSDSSSSKQIQFGADVTVESEVKEALSSCEKNHEAMDILVNCAGIEFRGTVVDATLNDYQRVMDTNVKSVFLMCKYGIPIILKTSRGGGSVINVSSDLGVQPIPGVDIYAASKGAIIALTKGMSKNWAKTGLRINCVLPGPIDTPLLRRFHSEETLQFVKEYMIPMGRLGTAEEIAKVVLFLASDQSSFINGAAITANGGLLG